MKLPNQCRFPLASTAVQVGCALAVWAIGTAAKWDGQAAILALPFVLLLWVSYAVALFASAQLLLKDRKLGLLCLTANLPATCFLIWTLK